MSKFYNVTLPFTGSLCVEVEADSEAQAIEAAFDIDVRITMEGAELVEWEPLERIVQGNVCYASQWEAEAEEID